MALGRFAELLNMVGPMVNQSLISSRMSQDFLVKCRFKQFRKRVDLAVALPIVRNLGHAVRGDIGFCNQQVQLEMGLK